MKTSLIHCVTLLLVLLFAVFSVDAQYKTLPKELDGTMMPYDFSTIESALAVPDSLEVVHVCYVARHGARYISSDKIVSKLSDILNRQLKEGSITKLGKRFMTLLAQITESTDSHWGALSDVGVKEEQALAAEMVSLFPDLLEKGEANAKSTFVPRVVMSMYEFMHLVQSEKPQLNIMTLSGTVNDSILRCFDTYQDYALYREKGAWKKVYDDFVNAHISPRPAVNILGISPSDEDKAKSLTMDIYSVLQSLRALGLPGPTDEWMSLQEYDACWEAANLQRYLRNALNPLSRPYIGATSGLIKALIDDADHYSGGVSAVVPLSAWFGHAETLMPMLSVMGIPGCCYSTDDWQSVSDHWKSEDIVPLGANFMLILLKPKKADSNSVYAMVRLNGHTLTPYANVGPIIEWSHLKSYWLSRLLPNP